MKKIVRKIFVPGIFFVRKYARKKAPILINITPIIVNFVVLNKLSTNVASFAVKIFI